MAGRLSGAIGALHSLHGLVADGVGAAQVIADLVDGVADTVAGQRFVAGMARLAEYLPALLQVVQSASDAGVLDPGVLAALGMG